MRPELTKPSSPFKFLNAYQREDGDIFFGREEEIERLYDSVNKNRLVLVYGQSGTGKTSLVQCGLSNRFEITDWLPLNIRRRKNINDSLVQALSDSKAIGGAIINKVNLLNSIERISVRNVRPVYLIFDQFEELLILGDEEEKIQFIQTIKKILESDITQSCNLIFILREEYFAWLHLFEQEIPQFARRRLRVEPMRSGHIQEVILQSCQCFNIQLESNQQSVHQIIKNLWSKGGISLPYLQVYLDMLWRENQINDKSSSKNDKLIVFSNQSVKKLGAIENVLDRFLLERITKLQQVLNEQFPNSDPIIARNILDAFVTEEATKRPIYYYHKGKQIAMAENAPEYLQQLPGRLLTICLNDLEKSRLLRMDDDTIELAHDTLAALIDQKRTEEQRRINRLHRLVRSNYEIGQPLTHGHLAEIGEDLSQLKLNNQLLRFIKQSQKIREQGRRQELNKERRKRRQATLGALIGLLLAGIAGISYWRSEKSLQKYEQAEAERLYRDANIYFDAKAIDLADSIYRKVLELNPEYAQKDTIKIRLNQIKKTKRND